MPWVMAKDIHSGEFFKKIGEEKVNFIPYEGRTEEEIKAIRADMEIPQLDSINYTREDESGYLPFDEWVALNFADSDRILKEINELKEEAERYKNRFINK